jgi:hypothetical protein
MVSIRTRDIASYSWSLDEAPRHNSSELVTELPERGRTILDPAPIARCGRAHGINLMFPLAHLGIGSAIGRVSAVNFRFRWILFGTLLPDLIDKPVFLLLGRYLHEAGWEAGKRGFAHTLAFLVLLAAISRARKSPTLWAVTAGTATHLALDVISKSTEGSSRTARRGAESSLQNIWRPR